MGSTYFSLHYHLIFGTKNVEPIILPAWRNRLHAYLGGCIREINGLPVAVGGVADHVHLLVGLRPTHTLSDFMRDVKSVSSRWVHDEARVRTFQWQEGYGAFCISASKIEVVRLYIEHQEEHHRKRTFREEYIEFLRESGVEFDDRYLSNRGLHPRLPSSAPPGRNTRNRSHGTASGIAFPAILWHP